MLRDSNRCNTFQPGLLTRKHSAWEQRKLGDCFDFLQNNTLSRAELSGEGGVARNVHYGDILVKFGDCLADDADGLPYIRDPDVAGRYASSALAVGDVVFADTAEDEVAGKCLELLKLPEEPTISGLHTIPARPRIAFGAGFLGHYLNSDAYHGQLLPLMQGIKVISVSKSTLQDTSVCFPSLPEQRAIGTLFARLDSLITLHQRQAEPPGTHANMFSVHQHGRPRYPKGRPWKLARARPTCSATITHSGSKCTRTGQFAASP